MNSGGHITHIGILLILYILVIGGNIFLKCLQWANWDKLPRDHSRLRGRLLDPISTPGYHKFLPVLLPHFPTLVNNSFFFFILARSEVLEGSFLNLSPLPHLYSQHFSLQIFNSQGPTDWRSRRSRVWGSEGRQGIFSWGIEKQNYSHWGMWTAGVSVRNQEAWDP